METDSPRADERHDNSWSVTLEHDRHAESRRAVIDEALDAELDDARWEFVDRCGCGGYVTRVFV